MAKTYTDATNTTVPRLTVIARYFKLPGESVQEFTNGMKSLTEADKEELADGAAKELGYNVVATA